MSKSLTIWAFIGALGAAGCMSQAEYLAIKQPTAIQTAVSRARFPGAESAGRRTRPVHNRRCGLQPTASL